MHNILTQRVYFVNNCKTIEQAEELERNYKRNYGENKVPDVLEIAISNKKVILKSDKVVLEFEETLNDAKKLLLINKSQTLKA